MQEPKDVEASTGAESPVTVHGASKYINFDNKDNLNPRTWPLSKRVTIAALTTYATMVVTLASAIFATAVPSLMRIYQIDREVATLGVSLFVLGFALGPMVWASFSELKGRYPPFIISVFGFTAFSFGTAVSKSTPSILICRYLAGFFGAGPLTLAGPINADMFEGKSFGISMVMFAFTVFMGPVVGQPVGGFIVMNKHLGWQWTQYLCGILGAAALVPLIFVLKETYAPVILARKAESIRKETGDMSIVAEHEDVSLSLRVILVEYVGLPITMLISDPIVLSMSLFGSFVYGLLYLFLIGYPVVFQMIHDMSPGVGGLPYLGLIVGQVLAVVAIFLQQPWMLRKTKENDGVIMPEWHLPVAVPGAVSFSIGLFWYGWTGYRRDIHWIVPTLSGILTGFGLVCTFVPSIAYLIQARADRPASAVAAHTFLRSLFGSIFPLFGFYMYKGMGVQWASTLLGCLAALMIPIPIVLYKYGPVLREKNQAYKVG
ncbi:hypothetical protein B0A52_04363 [Exophiala mesophila]|uniref:Major facilitator superfamily (MFS) profile domain-containing protein n=1 Tax=Exophiala mesophila TaxID=212818 RepID=A0A438N871_EXOME|nr:hypothetical protein B0A52_04363 [Exophiala mesophila]